MPATRPRTGRTPMSLVGVAGAVLVVLGLVLCVAFRLTDTEEQHSYTAGALAPYAVSLTAGRTYHVAIHDGVAAEQDRGLVPAALACSYTDAGGGSHALTIAAEASTSKATNVIATFIAPVGGRVHLACTGLGAVFVDDADDAAGDRSGAYLVLGVIALAIGVPLALSALRMSQQRRAYQQRSGQQRPSQRRPSPRRTSA